MNLNRIDGLRSLSKSKIPDVQKQIFKKVRFSPFYSEKAIISIIETSIAKNSEKCLIPSFILSRDSWADEIITRDSPLNSEKLFLYYVRLGILSPISKINIFREARERDGGYRTPIEPMYWNMNRELSKFVNSLRNDPKIKMLTSGLYPTLIREIEDEEDIFKRDDARLSYLSFVFQNLDDDDIFTKICKKYPSSPFFDYTCELLDDARVFYPVDETEESGTTPLTVGGCMEISLSVDSCKRGRFRVKKLEHIFHIVPPTRKMKVIKNIAHLIKYTIFPYHLIEDLVIFSMSALYEVSELSAGYFYEANYKSIFPTAIRGLGISTNAIECLTNSEIFELLFSESHNFADKGDTMNVDERRKVFESLRENMDFLDYKMKEVTSLEYLKKIKNFIREIVNTFDIKQSSYLRYFVSEMDEESISKVGKSPLKITIPALIATSTDSPLSLSPPTFAPIAGSPTGTSPPFAFERSNSATRFTPPPIPQVKRILQITSPPPKAKS